MFVHSIMKRLVVLLFVTYFFNFSSSKKAPNIIFLLTNDQRWDALGFAENDIIETPNMGNLTSEGILFKNAHVTTSICAVSRASMLSYQYSRKHGIHGFSKHFSNSAYQLTHEAKVCRI